jgi:hypothetical protein
VDQERYPSPEERMPDAPTGDPERSERELESEAEPDTKYQQLRDEEEAERDELAEDIGDLPPAGDDDQ